jgi:hypothetical protein
MRVSKCTSAIAAAAFVALLAVSSDASPSVAPGLLSGSTAQVLGSGPMAAIPMPLPGRTFDPFGPSVTVGSATPDKGGRCQRGAPCKPKCKKKKGVSPAYIFASDNVTGNVYEYCEDIPPGTTTPQVTYPGWGGWGLAISSATQRLAMAKKNGTISIYNVNAAGVLGAIGPAGKLHLGTPNAGALGLCFDSAGGLYATNYPTAEIDYFNNVEVGALAGNQFPTTSWQAQDGSGNPFYGYYLACDLENPGPDYVMVDGVDNGGNVDVAEFVGPGIVTPTISISQTLGPLASNYPGGLTLNSNDNLVVSDTYAGDLIDLGAVEPWDNGGSDRVCLVPGFPANAFLPISFDDEQNEIWAGNLMSVSSNFNTDAVSNAYPFLGSNCVIGQSGGPTAIIPREEFFGIAVSPNTGV